MSEKLLIVIVGPTASGKTDLAVKIARLFSTEIVSADSRQFYREMSIGTAKPTDDEMGRVVHHFINSHSIEEDYSIGKYEKEALQVLDDIFKRKDVAVMVGGSGLYIKVVCEGMDEIPDSDPEIRKELTERLNRDGMESLLLELEKVDPEFYEKADKANPQRIVRALEVFYFTGVPFSSFRSGLKKERPFKIVKVGLLWEREELYERINKRMDVMIESGLIEEARSLQKYKAKNALQTVGYKEVFDYLEGKYDLEECVRLLKRNTRRYAKRQMTWFNRDQEIRWFHPGQEDKIVEFLKSEVR